MINTEIIHKEIIDTECLDTRQLKQELDLENGWRLAYAEVKHSDEVYVDLMVIFCEFIEKKYPTEKSAEEQIKKPTGG